jgi:hypothetical protein
VRCTCKKGSFGPLFHFRSGPRYHDGVRVLVIAAALAAFGCAHERGLAEVSWRACAVTKTADGHDVDDGGVDVAATIARGRSERIAAGHYPGMCWAAPGELSRLVCSDPHVDVRYVLQWTRPTPTSLAVERLEYPVSSDDNVPDATTPRSRRTLRTFAIDAGTRVVVAPIPRCGR